MIVALPIQNGILRPATMKSSVVPAGFRCATTGNRKLYYMENLLTS